jgi:2-dehydro-3-deoxyphosphogalactonate aldolase
MSVRFERAMARLPLVAIMRGMTPREAPAMLDALIAEGFTLVEIPLNSPEPLKSIEIMRKAAPADVLIGAGTVLEPQEVASVAAAGGELIISPNANLAVIGAAKDRNLISLPGAATPTEAFGCLAAGAAAVKAFPAEMIGPAVLKAWRAVIPGQIAILPVGGIALQTMGPFVAAGASGFGLGSALYKPGDAAGTVKARAREFAGTWRALKG